VPIEPHVAARPEHAQRHVGGLVPGRDRDLDDEPAALRVVLVQHALDRRPHGVAGDTRRRVDPDHRRRRLGRAHGRGPAPDRHDEQHARSELHGPGTKATRKKYNDPMNLARGRHADDRLHRQARAPGPLRKGMA